MSVEHAGRRPVPLGRVVFALLGLVLCCVLWFGLPADVAAGLPMSAPSVRVVARSGPESASSLGAEIPSDGPSSSGSPRHQNRSEASAAALGTAPAAAGDSTLTPISPPADDARIEPGTKSVQQVIVVEVPSTGEPPTSPPSSVPPPTAPPPTVAPPTSNPGSTTGNGNGGNSNASNGSTGSTNSGGSSNGSLPRTGVTGLTWRLLVLGLAFVDLGWLISMLTRRRRRADAVLRS